MTLSWENHKPIYKLFYILLQMLPIRGISNRIPEDKSKVMVIGKHIDHNKERSLGSDVLKEAMNIHI